MDVHWLLEHVKNLTLEIATVRGDAAKQLAARDREIAILRAGRVDEAERLEATTFAQANVE